MPFVSVSFTGSDGATVESTDPNWGGGSGLTILGNRAHIAAAAPTAYYYNTAPSSADYSVSSFIYATSTYGISCGPTARHSTSAQTFYHFRFATGSGWQLFKFIAGAPTQLGSTIASTSFAAGQTKKATIEVSGTTLKCYVDGSLVIGPITDTSITAANRPGMRFTANAVGGDIASFSADYLVTSIALAALNAAGAGAATAGALSQTHGLAALDAAGAGAATAGALSQTHDLAASDAAGAGSAGAGWLVQEHLLAVLDAIGKGRATTGAIFLGIPAALGTITDPSLFRATPTRRLRSASHG